MNKITLFHGTEKSFTNPIYGYGNPHNDYGLAFYLTPSYDLAGEWGCKIVNEASVNEYELNLEGLNVLDLRLINNSVLVWVSILLHFRDLGKYKENTYKVGLDYLKKYYVDISKYDVVIGYRADDSYYVFPMKFLDNTLTKETLEEIFRLGDLGVQYALISKKAFAHLAYINTKTGQYHEQYIKRINDAVIKYKEYENNDRYKEGTRLRDLINNDKQSV